MPSLDKKLLCCGRWLGEDRDDFEAFAYLLLQLAIEWRAFLAEVALGRYRHEESSLIPAPVHIRKATLQARANSRFPAHRARSDSRRGWYEIGFNESDGYQRRDHYRHYVGEDFNLFIRASDGLHIQANPW